MKLPSRLIILFCILFAVIFLFITWEQNEKFALGIIPFVIGIAVAVVMSPQIDWWWYSKHPRDIDPTLAILFEKHLFFYQKLSDNDKLRFRQRTDLYLMAVEFIVPSKDEDKSIPEDLKHWIAAYYVMTTFHKSSFFNDKFEKIVAYMKPFPSPAIPQYLHSTESFEEDGVLLFALEPMIHAVMEPNLCFNPVLYEFCKIYQLKFWSKNPEINDSHWEVLEKISGFSKAQVYETINLPEIDVRAVAHSYFLLFPEQFKKNSPVEYNQFSAL